MFVIYCLYILLLKPMQWSDESVNIKLKHYF